MRHAHRETANNASLRNLRHTYSDQQSALRAARAEWNRLQRRYRRTIIWHGGNVQHSLTADAGYTMSLELESQLPEDTLEELVTAATTLAPSPGTETQKPGNNARSLPATRLGRSG